ncbi:hypothetical protein UVI_02017900 [Ustilaginoidea virens]|uniref:Uncharacterized protein n=1 Tax=Ustilaginoidea virens TaxID=1159556 RepID=A0A1B5KS62_USTVR|nr:hypothetical protein UVI_02017900 [Ustilaginoidea virens]
MRFSITAPGRRPTGGSIEQLGKIAGLCCDEWRRESSAASPVGSQHRKQIETRTSARAAPRLIFGTLCVRLDFLRETHLRLE